MIYLTGDTHGLIDFQKLKDYFSKRYASKRDVLIILGDAGIVWSEEDCSLFQYEFLQPTVLFIDGNHENFSLLNQFPVVEIYGAKAHYLTSNVYHIMRGEVLHIDGLSFLCLGGATSIDAYQRTPYVSWWPEEHIQARDIENALKNLDACGGSVDYILTHCAPTAIVRGMFGYSGDQDTRMLDVIQDRAKFGHWCFGHYHEDKESGIYRCFYQDILEMPAMNTGKRKVKQHLLGQRNDGPNDPLYHWNTGRKVGLTSAELPDWFYRDYSQGTWFYDVSGVTDVAFHRSSFSSHISKYSRIYLAYDGRHPKAKNLEPKNEKDWQVICWRVHIVSFTLALEKYSPNLNLGPLKAQINLTYDQFNNHSSNFYDRVVEVRPFPEIKTPRYVDKNSKEKARYEVVHRNRVLSTFIKLDLAIRYAELYVTQNLRVSTLRFETGDAPLVRAYDTWREKAEWVFIRGLDGEANR